MGSCLGYEEPRASILLAHYDPYKKAYSPYRLECRIAYKEYLLQPKAQTIKPPVATNRNHATYIPPKPTKTVATYSQLSSEEAEM